MTCLQDMHLYGAYQVDVKASSAPGTSSPAAAAAAAAASRKHLKGAAKQAKNSCTFWILVMIPAQLWM
jgi:hypothetical protein